jgi:hypothetical protein
VIEQLSRARSENLGEFGSQWRVSRRGGRHENPSTTFTLICANNKLSSARRAGNHCRSLECASAAIH